MVAGYILFRALGERVAIGRIVEDVAKALWRHLRLSEKTIHNDVRPLFRPVVHFWAAYFGSFLNGDETFPCRVEELPIFLSRAEAYRALGQQTRLPHSPFAVIREDECVALPPAVLGALPSVELVFQVA